MRSSMAGRGLEAVDTQDGVQGPVRGTGPRPRELMRSPGEDDLFTVSEAGRL